MPDSPIAPVMTDNDALRSMVAELRIQNDFLLGRYASIIGSKDIDVPKLGPATLEVSGLSVGAAPVIGGTYTRGGVHNGEWFYYSPRVVVNPPSPDPASYYKLFKFDDGTHILQTVGSFTTFPRQTNRWESADGLGGTYIPHGAFTNTTTYGVPVVTPGNDAALLVIRAANLLSIKTLVTNQGTGTMQVYEGGFLVAVLDQYDTWVSPLTGRGEIAVAGLGDPTTCAIATYLSA